MSVNPFYSLASLSICLSQTQSGHAWVLRPNSGGGINRCCQNRRRPRGRHPVLLHLLSIYLSISLCKDRCVGPQGCVGNLVPIYNLDGGRVPKYMDSAEGYRYLERILSGHRKQTNNSYCLARYLYPGENYIPLLYDPAK